MGFVGWLVAGAVVRRIAPRIVGRAAQYGWAANALAGLALVLIERVIVGRRVGRLPLLGLSPLRRRPASFARSAR